MHGFLVTCALQQWSISILTLQRVSLSQTWILTSFTLLFKRLYNIYPPNRVCHFAQRPSRQLCFLFSLCSFSSQCNRSQIFKANKLYILSILRLNALDKPQSPLLLSQVLLKTQCIDNTLCKPAGLGGLTHGIMQLLLWERCIKPNQLSGLKSRAISSSFNYTELYKYLPIMPYLLSHEDSQPMRELSLDERDII